MNKIKNINKRRSDYNITYQWVNDNKRRLESIFQIYFKNWFQSHLYTTNRFQVTKTKETQSDNQWSKNDMQKLNWSQELNINRIWQSYNQWSKNDMQKLNWSQELNRNTIRQSYIQWSKPTWKKKFLLEICFSMTQKQEGKTEFEICFR